MSKTIQIETRQRGFIGKIFKWLFILFNILMLVWIIAGVSNVSGIETANEYEAAGAAIGTAIGVGMLIGLWVCGDLILGMFMFFTRGKKIIETKVIEE